MFLLFTGAPFLAKLGGEVSRLWLSAFFFCGLATLIAEPLLQRTMVRSWARDGRLDRRTIVVGSDQNGETLIDVLEDPGRPDIDILGVFDDRNDTRALDTCAGSLETSEAKSTTSSNSLRRTRIDPRAVRAADFGGRRGFSKC